MYNCFCKYITVFSVTQIFRQNISVNFLTLVDITIIMDIEIEKVTIVEIGEDEVELLTRYRMAYLTELQGERAPEYRENLKHELDLYFKEAFREERCFAFMAKRGDYILSFGAMILKKIPGDFNKPFYLEGDILNMYTIDRKSVV